eukprot:2217956-Karenia_brevis.AAC.1
MAGAAAFVCAAKLSAPGPVGSPTAPDVPSPPVACPVDSSGGDFGMFIRCWLGCCIGWVGGVCGLEAD